MGSQNEQGGWQTVDIRDSFIACPVENLSPQDREEAVANIGDYYLMFAPTTKKSRPDGTHVFLPDYLAKQPLHIFCTLATNYDENKITFGQAIEHDRALAQEELKNQKTANAPAEEIEKTEQFLSNLKIIENVAVKGEQAPLHEDVVELVDDAWKNGNDVATDKGVKYFMYKYDGFRPLY